MGTSILGGALDGAPSELIVYVGNDRLEGGSAGTDRQMAEALMSYGPVLYVEPPISALTRLRKPELGGLASLPPLQVVTPRLARLIPRVLPGITWPLLHRLVGPMLARAIRGAVRQLFGSAAINDLPVAAVVSSCVELLWTALPARHTLFYCTDDPVSGSEFWGIPRERLLRFEALTLHNVDAVAVVSPALRERYAKAGFAAELVPNGCNPNAYIGVDNAPLPLDVKLPRPVAGFVGQINDRIDLGLLEAVAETGRSLLLVGPVARTFRSAARFSTLAERPNVCCVGPKPYAELPSYLRIIDVGLTPYTDSAFNRASFPLKTLEYLAAGRPVVSTPLPANDWLSTELVEVAAGPADYAAQVCAALARPHNAELAARRRAFARKHSWSNRAEMIAKLLGLVPDSTPREKE